MAVTLNPPELLSRGVEDTYRFTWSSDLPTPTFYIYRDGVALTPGGTTETELIVPVLSGESAIIEVLDDAGALPERVFSGRATLGWHPSTGAEKYRVEEYVASVWVLRQTVFETGRGWYTWQSEVLADSSAHQFRAVPVGGNGVDGMPIAFDLYMVRHPDPAEAVQSYSPGTGELTFSAV